MADDDDDLLKISTRIDSFQMARLLATQGKHAKALKILRKLLTKYQKKADEKMSAEVSEFIAEVEQRQADAES